MNYQQQHRHGLILALLLLLLLAMLSSCGKAPDTSAPDTASTPVSTTPPPSTDPSSSTDMEPMILRHYADYPVTGSLADMYRLADLIVIGHYEELEQTWNMSRNPENPVEESPTDRFEGRIYSFAVERVLKGTTDQTTIHINIPYQKRIQGEAPLLNGDPNQPQQGDPFSFDFLWEFYIEPNPAETNILFLAHNHTSEQNFPFQYYPANEPFTITISADKLLTLRSNLLLPEEQRQEKLRTAFTTESGQTMFYEIRADQLTDEISGQSLEEFLTELKQLAPGETAPEQNDGVAAPSQAR